MAEGRVAEARGRPGREPLPARAARRRRPRRRLQQPIDLLGDAQSGGLARRLRYLWYRLLTADIPRGLGLAGTLLIIVSAIVYGAVRGGHVPEALDEVRAVRDMAANAVGLRIAGVALSGNSHLTREEILAAAGVNGRTSLLFLDVADARLKLKTNPWIAEATVQKLYPDRLQITVTERTAFALWQKDGRVGVIAEDGTVLEPYVSRRFTGLPLFVGEGAERSAKEFSTLMAQFPAIRDDVRAAIMVAGRRWNLRLKSGIDVRLPEIEPDKALTTLAALDRDKKLLSRDIVAIDLRLPDRVTVRLSEDAATAREEAWKAKKAKAKPGSA